MVAGYTKFISDYKFKMTDHKKKKKVSDMYILKMNTDCHFQHYNI